MRQVFQTFRGVDESVRSGVPSPEARVEALVFGMRLEAPREVALRASSPLRGTLKAATIRAGARNAIDVISECKDAARHFCALR